MKALIPLSPHTLTGSRLSAVCAIALSLLLPLSALAQQGAVATREEHHEADSLPETHRAPDETESAEAKPESLEIVAGGISLRFGGFVKLDFIQDFDYVGNEDQFKVATIPVEGDPNASLGGSTNLSARQTRFTLDVRGDTGKGQLRAYVEGDFFGSGNSFRMRHGYGEWRGLLAGQTWTTFQDITARPFTLDYEGPDSEIFVRQSMLRYSAKVNEELTWAVALEDPDSQVTTSGVSGGGRSELPDLVGRFRLERQWGHFQLAAIMRQLRFVSDDGSVDETTGGYGFNFSGSGNVFGDDVVMGHVAFGTGIGRYIEAFSGLDTDAVMTPANSLEALDAWAWVLGYTHQWTGEWRSTASFGTAEIDNDPNQPGNAIKNIKSAHVNLVYEPVPRVVIGGELMWGEREDFDGSDGDATRLQISVQYKFR